MTWLLHVQLQRFNMRLNSWIPGWIFFISAILQFKHTLCKVSSKIQTLLVKKKKERKGQDDKKFGSEYNG